MKKTILKFTGLLLIIIALISCDKDTVEPNIIEFPLCKVTNAITESYLQGGSLIITDTSTVTYNADGYPDKTTFSSSLTSFTYIYNAGKLSKRIETSGAEINEKTYEWDGDKIIKIAYEKVVGAETFSYESRYEYDVDEIYEISFWNNSSGVMTKSGYTKFSWSGGNLTKEELYSIDNSGIPVEYITISYTYDGKLNPSQFFGYIQGSPRAMSNNNVLTATQTKTGFGTIFNESYTYEYNADNFPTKITHLGSPVGIDQRILHVKTYTYDCN